MNSFEDVIFSGKPIHVDNFFFGEVNKQYLSFGFGNVSNFVKKPIKFRYKFMKKKTHKDYLIQFFFFCIFEICKFKEIFNL